MNDDMIDITERRFASMLEELDNESKRYRSLQVAVSVCIFCFLAGGIILEEIFFHEMYWALRLLLVAVVAGVVTVSIVFVTNYPRRKRVELTTKAFPPFLGEANSRTAG